MVAGAQHVQYRAIVSALHGLADAVLVSIHVGVISFGSVKVTIDMEPEQHTVFVGALQEALKLPGEQEA